MQMTVVVPPAGEYTVDPARSRIAFTAKHRFGLGTVRGSFAVRSGAIAVAENPTASTVQAVVDTTSFASGSRARDKKVASKAFLHAQTYPDIAFQSGRAQLDDSGVWTLEGTLTARSVSAPVEFTIVDATTSGGELALTATATVDRYAHGITAAKGMAGRYLQLTAEVYADQHTSAA
jgi:polyisoprenoid-binding protein YceI